MSTLTVTFLGSGDAFGSGGRLQASIYAAREQGGAFLIDCGCTVMIGLRRLGLDPNEITTIFISHLHGDHFGGLVFFILDAQLVSKRTRSLKIITPPGGREKVTAMMDILFPGSAASKKPFNVQIEEIFSGLPYHEDGFITSAHPVNHSGLDALALRIEVDGKIIAYSGDAEWTDSLIACAKDADLFVVEAYSLNRKIKFHLDLADLRENTSKINAKQYILTHMSKEVLDLPEDEFRGCVRAFDGLSVQL